MKTFGSNIYQLPTAQSGIRNFAVAGDFTLGSFTNAKFIRNTGDVREMLSWTKGQHAFAFGFDLETPPDDRQDCFAGFARRLR